MSPIIPALERDLVVGVALGRAPAYCRGYNWRNRLQLDRRTQTPSTDDFVQRERIRFLPPLVVRRSRLAVRAWLRPVELHPRRNMERASEYNSLAGRQDRDLIEKTSRLNRNDALKVVDVVRILQPVRNEIGALADNSLADLARPLACDYQRQAELPAFLGNTLIR